MDYDKKLNKKNNIIYCILAILILVVLLFPLYWTINTSLKTEQEIF